MTDIRQQLSPRAVLLGVLIAAGSIQFVMILTMPIITTFDTATLLGGIDTYPLPGFPLFAAVTGIVWHDTVVYFLACQALLSVLITLAPVHLALRYDRPVAAAFIGISLLATLVPFVFSFWLMTDHLYMFFLVSLVWCYGMLLLSGQLRYAIGLAVALWLAQITRPTGSMLFAVVGLAIAISLCIDRGSFLPRLGSLAGAGVFFGVLFIVGGHFFSMKVHSDDAADWKGRWLFCQIYSQSGVEGQIPVTLENASSLDTIAAALREKLAGNPPLLVSLITRWPEYFGRYKDDGSRLAEDIIRNRQPLNKLAEHKFCWVVMSVLDDSFGIARTNVILLHAWREFLWAHPSVVGTIYVAQLVDYFFKPPDYSQVTWFSNDIGVSRLGPHAYSEIYGVGLRAEKSNFFQSVCRYVFSVYMTLTPILSLLAAFSLLIIFTRRAYAPVLLLCFGIVLYHGLATAISNVVTIRYVFVIYPELIALAIAGLFAGLLMIKVKITSREINY